MGCRIGCWEAGGEGNSWVREGDPRGWSASVPCLPSRLGCAGEVVRYEGFFPALWKGLYTILCPPGPPHCPHFHLLGADEQGLQASLPQWLRQVRSLESLHRASVSPPAPTVSVPPQPWGPGLYHPGPPLFIFPTQCGSLLSQFKNFGLSCPAPAHLLALISIISVPVAVPWGGPWKLTGDFWGLLGY